jgi:spore coat protein H
MTSRRVDRACVGKAHRARPVIQFLALVTCGLFCTALWGCGQQPDPPAPARKSTPTKPQLAFTNKDGRHPSQPLDASAQRGRLPLYEIKIDAKDLTALERSAHSNETLPATFIADGEVYERVKVRYRGAWARSWPKKPLKIFFNDDKPFQGQRRLNLNSGWRDPAFVRETLAYDIYAACGAPGPKSRMVRLHVNGEFRGLYVEVEQPDKAFVSRLGLKGAAIYKASSQSNQSDERDLGSEASYRAHYEKETQKAEDYRDLQLFCQELALTKNTLDFFTRRVDLEKYINYLAATTLVQNWDAYNKNHFIVYDGRGSKKWFVVPWDLDRTLGDHWNWSFDRTDLPILLGTRQLPGVTGWNRIEDRFFSDPTLRSRFLDRLSELLDKEFTAEKLFPTLDQLEAEISADAALDRQRWPSQTDDVHGGIAQVKRFIERRRAFLLSEVGKLRRSTPIP